MKYFLILPLLSALPLMAQNRVAAPLEDVNHVVDLTLDSLDKAQTARIPAGSSRHGNNPVLFLIGNSTMRNGTLGNGNNGQWGWGFYEHAFWDENKITVENQALGGMSSRTYYNKLWPDVRKAPQRPPKSTPQVPHPARWLPASDRKDRHKDPYAVVAGCRCRGGRTLHRPERDLGNQARRL